MVWAHAGQFHPARSISGREKFFKNPRISHQNYFVCLDRLKYLCNDIANYRNLFGLRNENITFFSEPTIKVQSAKFPVFKSSMLLFSSATSAASMVKVGFVNLVKDSSATPTFYSNQIRYNFNSVFALLALTVVNPFTLEILKNIADTITK